MKKISFVTLGVLDLSVSRKFYEKLFGWKPSRKSVAGEIAFYDMGGWIFALYPWKLLAKDAGVPVAGKGFRGAALAHNVRTKKEVAIFLSKARRCGAKIVKGARQAEWGGHTGYFADPSGHLWEVAHNPFMPELVEE